LKLQARQMARHLARPMEAPMARPMAIHLARPMEVPNARQMAKTSFSSSTHIRTLQNM